MNANPYTAPYAAPDSPRQINAQGPYGSFRKNGALKFILITLLIFDSVLVILNSGVFSYLDILQHENSTYLEKSEPNKLDNIITMAGTAHAILAILLIITFAIWINRSCKNAWLLDAPRMRTTPGWSVGYYFIPILNLWKPYAAMKEICSASYGNDNSLHAVLPLWWAFWLISNLIGSVIFRLLINSKNIESYLTACKLEIISVPIDLILNYLVITLVSSITLAQARRIAQWRP